MSETKKDALSTRMPRPLAATEVFGALPLVRGDNSQEYEQLLARVSEALRPSDILEEIWVRDVVDLVWETFRFRRIRASHLTDAARKAVQSQLWKNAASEEERESAGQVAVAWAAAEPEAEKSVAAALSAAMTSDALIADGLWGPNIDKLERIDRTLVSAEARRSAALRELDRYRALAQRLHQGRVRPDDPDVRVIPGLAPSMRA